MQARPLPVMKSVMVGLALAFACACMFARCSALESAPGADGKLKAGVVKIRAGTDEGGGETSWRTGSGFIVLAKSDRHYVLTVTHVVKGADEIRLDYYGSARTSMSARVARMEGGDVNGLAVLEVAGKIPVGASAVYAGPSDPLPRAVTAVGFQRGGANWHTSRGAVNGMQGRAMAFSAPVDSGNSGGPLFNADGHYVGIVTSTRAKTAYATRVIFIKETLKGWGYTLPQPPREIVSIYGGATTLQFQNIKVEHLQKDGDGFVLFGIDHRDKTPNRVLVKLDADFRAEKPVKFFRSEKSDDQISWSGSLPGGNYGILEREKVGFFYNSHFYVFDSSGKQRSKLTRDNTDPDDRMEINNAIALPGGNFLTIDFRSGINRYMVSYWKDARESLVQETRLEANAILDMAPLSDGGALVCGRLQYSSQPAVTYETRLWRLSSTGKLTHRYQTDRKSHDGCQRIIPLRSGGALMSVVHVPRLDTMLLRLDDELKVIWSKSTGRSDYGINQLLGVDQAWELKNGDLLVTALIINAEGRLNHMWRMDAKGKVIWKRKFKGGEFKTLLEEDNGDLLLGGAHLWGFLTRLGAGGELLPVRK